LPQWCLIERNDSVRVDGIMPWILEPTGRISFEVNGQLTKTTS
jgi:hypothetical protein